MTHSQARPRVEQLGSLLRGSLVTAAGAILLWPSTACRQRAAPAPASSISAPAAPTPQMQTARAIVTGYRSIIALLANEADYEPARRREVEMVAWLLFHENHKRLTALTEQLSVEIEAALAPAPAAVPDGVSALLGFIEENPDLHDADKLAFQDTLADLRALLAEPRFKGKTPAGLSARLAGDQAALVEIRALYEKEIERIFGRFETRGMTVRREAWESYVTFVRSRVDVDQLIAERQDLLRSVAGKRGSEAAASLEISGAGLPAKSLVLTFDDGPHPRYTERIEAILKRFGVKAVFFELGERLGSVGRDGRLRATRSSTAARRLLEGGFALANHSYSHALFTKLTDRQIGDEIETTDRMLRDVAGAKGISLFRAPYGARNQRVLAALAARGMHSILWNIDSRDWADPIPMSIANRAIKTVESEKRGIILFHDIQERTVEALPLVLETLTQRGYRFLAWNGREFVAEASGPGAEPAPSPADTTTSALYRQSWALIVGIDQYAKWPRLSYAANDARGMRDLLVSRFGFKPENITLLLNDEATRERILSALGGRLADPAKVQREDRVFVFFAGHGITRKLPSGRSLGYLVPVDADPTSLQSQAISMTNLQDVSDAIPAKHVLFVMDACYSGIALTRAAATGVGLNYLREITGRSVRQVLTAGGADEEVADGGPSGHSVFTWTLMEGLSGKADLSADGYITASELAAYVGPAVSALSRQTPAFGNLVGSEGGEFVFDLGHRDEFLNETSAQLDDEALRLNAELDKLRAGIEAKRKRNQTLRQELAAARANLGQAGSQGDRTGARATIDRGNALYRERRYDEALSAFEAAAKLDPTSALAANNVGFVYFKLGKLTEAVDWFEKTIALDPRRAVTHVNLGDALAGLGRKTDARRAYEQYLDLAPGGKNADAVRRKIGALK